MGINGAIEGSDDVGRESIVVRGSGDGVTSEVGVDENDDDGWDWGSGSD